ESRNGKPGPASGQIETALETPASFDQLQNDFALGRRRSKLAFDREIADPVFSCGVGKLPRVEPASLCLLARLGLLALLAVVVGVQIGDQLRSRLQTPWWRIAGRFR